MLLKGLPSNFFPLNCSIFLILPYMIIDIIFIHIWSNLSTTHSPSPPHPPSPHNLAKTANRRLTLTSLRRNTSSKNTTKFIDCEKVVNILKVLRFNITKCIKRLSRHLLCNSSIPFFDAFASSFDGYISYIIYIYIYYIYIYYIVYIIYIICYYKEEK